MACTLAFTFLYISSPNQYTRTALGVTSPCCDFVNLVSIEFSPLIRNAQERAILTGPNFELASNSTDLDLPYRTHGDHLASPQEQGPKLKFPNRNFQTSNKLSRAKFPSCQGRRRRCREGAAKLDFAACSSFFFHHLLLSHWQAPRTAPPPPHRPAREVGDFPLLVMWADDPRYTTWAAVSKRIMLKGIVNVKPTILRLRVFSKLQ